MYFKPIFHDKLCNSYRKPILYFKAIFHDKLYNSYRKM